MILTRYSWIFSTDTLLFRHCLWKTISQSSPYCCANDNAFSYSSLSNCKTSHTKLWKPIISLHLNLEMVQLLGFKRRGGRKVQTNVFASLSRIILPSWKRSSGLIQVPFGYFTFLGWEINWNTFKISKKKLTFRLYNSSGVVLRSASNR